jgi:hypothetical protein
VCEQKDERLIRCGAKPGYLPRFARLLFIWHDDARQ